MADGNNNNSGRNNDDDEDGDEGNLAEASLAEASSPDEIIIKEVRSLSVSSPHMQIITID